MRCIQLAPDLDLPDDGPKEDVAELPVVRLPEELAIRLPEVPVVKA